MKVIDLQTMCAGDQKIAIEKYDGYCDSVMEITYIKDLDESEYKDEEIDMISAANDTLWVRL